jgi:hypothetical protein
MWRTTCRLLSLDVRTGRPMRPTDPFSEPMPGDSSGLTAR